MLYCNVQKNTKFRSKPIKKQQIAANRFLVESVRTHSCPSKRHFDVEISKFSSHGTWICLPPPNKKKIKIGFFLSVQEEIKSDIVIRVKHPHLKCCTHFSSFYSSLLCAWMRFDVWFVVEMLSRTFHIVNQMGNDVDVFSSFEFRSQAAHFNEFNGTYWIILRASMKITSQVKWIIRFWTIIYKKKCPKMVAPTKLFGYETKKLKYEKGLNENGKWRNSWIWMSTNRIRLVRAHTLAPHHHHDHLEKEMSTHSTQILFDYNVKLSFYVIVLLKNDKKIRFHLCKYGILMVYFSQTISKRFFLFNY